MMKPKGEAGGYVGEEVEVKRSRRRTRRRWKKRGRRRREEEGGGEEEEGGGGGAKGEECGGDSPFQFRVRELCRGVRELLSLRPW
jgi:hypothetical protein